MRMNLVTAALLGGIMLWMTLSRTSLAEQGPKPRTRDAAETHDENLLRYPGRTFAANANQGLGVRVKYRCDSSCGAMIRQFETDSPAQESGLKVDERILEVDGSPVGLIRGRYYEMYNLFARPRAAQVGQEDPVEVLVEFVRSDGTRRYFYPQVRTQAIYEKFPVASRRTEYSVADKPRDRSNAEGEIENRARYVADAERFKTDATHELGVVVKYSHDRGATITSVDRGKSADQAGLRPGDMILEVGGAPVGKIGGRIYGVWRQYAFDSDGTIEFLVCYEGADGDLRYYYPEITLTPRG